MKLFYFVIIATIIFATLAIAEDKPAVKDEYKNVKDVAGLIGLLDDKRKEVRAYAVKMLGINLKEPDIIERLIKQVIKDEDPEIKELTLKILAGLKDKRMLSIAYAFYNSSERVKDAAAQFIFELGGKDEIDNLITLLKSAKASEASFAANVLVKFGKYAFPKVIELYAASGELIRGNIKKYLIGCGKPMSTELISKFKSTDNKDLKWFILNAMGEINDKGSIPFIVGLLYDVDYQNEKLYSVIRKIGKDCLPEIAKVIASKQIKDIKVLETIKGLRYYLGDPALATEAATKIKEMLQNKNAKVFTIYKHHVIVLFESGRIQDLFNMMVQYNKFEIKVWSNETAELHMLESVLSGFRYRIVPILITSLKNSQSKDLSEFCSKVLNTITGESFGTKCYDWDKWWKNYQAEQKTKEVK